MGLFLYSLLRPEPVRYTEKSHMGSVLSLTYALGPWTTVVYPEAVRAETNKKFAWAGKMDMAPAEFLSQKLVLGGAIAVFGALMMMAGKNALPVFLLAFLGYVFPDMRLNRQIRERQRKIRRDVPEFAVLLATVLEAGGGNMLNALVLVGQNLGGEIGSEIEVLVHEINTGKRRSLALKDMAARCGVEEMTQLVDAIVQAEYYGTPVADAVKAFAGKTREIRRREAEKRMKQQTVKMIFPMVLFFILPILVFVGYPALRQFSAIIGH
ncbi:MAG: type II secretion system F family protein [Firmicutes bacterium]|nr:type II secretion system F family protein [Bacillota bacterium]